MKSYRWLWVACIGLVAGALVSSVRLPLFRLRQDTHDWHIVTAQNDARVLQTFLSHYGGITAITLQATEPLPPDNQLVTLCLSESGQGHCGGVILTRRVGSIREGTRLRFEFAPLDESQAKVYSIEIETHGTMPLKLVGHSLNLYTEGALSGGGDLMFEVDYNGRLGPTMGRLLRRLAANKPGLLGQAWFYAAVGVSYLLALVAMMARIAKSMRSDYSM